MPVIARAFEKILYDIHVCDIVQEKLSRMQFAYRVSGNCTCALLAMQHRIHSYLDNPDCTPWTSVRPLIWSNMSYLQTN